MNKLHILLFSSVLMGCSSIPLTTMMKFSGYQKTDFFNINPSELRVKAKINSSARMDLVTATRLSASIDDENGKTQYQFQLVKTRLETIPAEKGIFANKPAFDVYHLKLTKQSTEYFNKMKEQTSSTTQKRGSFSAGLDWRKPIKFEDEDILFSVMLQLSPREDFFTLIDEYKLQQPQNN